MNAYRHSLRIKPCGDCRGGVVATGSGKAVKTDKCGEQVTGFVDFRATVWDDGFKDGFQVVFNSCQPELCYDSGFIEAKASRWRIRCD